MTLIDKAALLNRIATEVHYDSEHSLEMYAKLLSEINDAPDALIRCKDCKWGTPHPEGDEYTKCFKLCTTFFSGHYCAWGERKEDETGNTYSIGKIELPKGVFRQIYDEERREDDYE